MFSLRKGYEVDVTVKVTDDEGAAATVDGVPVWSVSNAEFAIIPAADGRSAVLQGVGNTIGATAVLTFNADADLGAGVTPLTRSEDLTLVSGTATEVSFGFGTPREIV